MRRSCFYVLFCILFLLPRTAHGALSITEVAWMGTAGSQFSEWIELFNDGESEVDLSRFVLLGGTSTVIFTLTKKIAPGGYYLLERTTASSPDAVVGVDDDAGTWGGGGLSNSGEHLVLKDPSGQAVFTLDAASGWPAGDASSKETMQWSGSSWVTAPATPRSATTATVSSSGPSGSSSSSSGGGNASSRSTATDSASSHSSPVPLSAADLDRPVISLDAGRNRFALAGSPVRFVALGKKNGDPLISPTYEWSFGDGSSVTDPAPSHIYEFPGMYHVVLNVSDGADSSVARTVVRVEDTSFLSIAPKLPGDQSFEVVNNNTREANIGGFQVSNGKELFRFPLDTIIGEKEKVVVPYSISRLSLLPGNHVVFLRPDGKKIGEAVVPSDEPAFEIISSSTISSLEKIKPELVRTEGQPKKLATPKKTQPLKPSKVSASVAQAAPLSEVMATSSPEEIIISVPKQPGVLSRLWQQLFGKTK